MIGTHEFKITVQPVGDGIIMDVVYKFNDGHSEHFRDSSWIGKVEPDKLENAICQVIKATFDSSIRASVPLLLEALK